MPASQARFGLQAKARSHDVALFIDWENLKSSLSQANMRVNLTSLRETAETLGRLVIANAYADWQDDWHRSDPENLYAAGIEPVYVPTRVVTESTGMRRRKNSVDIKLTADCVECCHNHPNINTFILVSGDGDFIHMVNTLRPYGKQVVAIGVSWSTSPRLADRVDQFLYYDRDVDPVDAHRYRSDGPAADERENAELQRTLGLVVDIVGSSQHGDRALLSWIKNELIRRLRHFDESRFGFPKFKLFMREAERRGLLHIVEDGLVDWAYLPGAGNAEELAVCDVEGLEPVEETATPAIVRFADELESRSPYVAFMYLVDQIMRAAIVPHLRRDQLMLVLNRAVDDLIFLRGGYTLEDPLTGEAKNIRTLVLNREHALVREALATPLAPGAPGYRDAPAESEHGAEEAPVAAGDVAEDPELTRVTGALKSDPDSTALLMSVARRCYQLRRYDEAIRHQERAVALEPENVEYRCLLARTFSAAQQFEVAASLCRQTIDLAPTHPLPRVTLGSILYAREDSWQEAAGELLQALDLLTDNVPQKAQLLLNVARCYERLDDEAEAMRHCEEGLAIAPDHPGLLEFQTYMGMNPRQREGYQLAKHAAALAVQPGQEEQTIEAAQKAIAADPEQYLPYYALGEVYQRLRQLRVAAENLEKAAELCSNPGTRAAVHQKLARLYAKLGNPERTQPERPEAADPALDRVTADMTEEA
jgi:tetratricopeptide (TPR) repeat protein/uncharacterized LabA/DUF88 family protein